MHRVFCCTKHLGYKNIKAKQDIHRNKDAKIDMKPLWQGISKNKEQSLLPANLQRDSTNFFSVATPLPQKENIYKNTLAGGKSKQKNYTVVIKLMSNVRRKRHSPILISQEAYQLAKIYLL